MNSRKKSQGSTVATLAPLISGVLTDAVSRRIGSPRVLRQSAGVCVVLTLLLHGVTPQQSATL